MSDFEWTLESRQPFMDGKTQYNLRRPGLMGIRGYVTLSHAEHEDLTRRLSDTPGVVRVDTNDETLVERLAAIVGRSAAREVLAALREAS